MPFRFEFRFEQRLTQRLLPDKPATGSIFKKVNIRLDELEYQRAFKFFAKYKKIERYVDRTDFLFAECFPNPWRKKCFDYYYRDGCQLINDPNMTPELIVYYDKLLCLILDLAVFLMNNPYYQHRGRWSMFMQQLRHVLAEHNLDVPLLTNTQKS